MVGRIVRLQLGQVNRRFDSFHFAEQAMNSPVSPIIMEVLREQAQASLCGI